ncbi:MAG: CRISPR system precrRNA processing endoribonuclease RAMP protein Cas6 [Candidatus Tectomicrobia bacterium]|nr:CRISPR system precrRNA processing endoribonuclease RAMP protein Cas6 [Candidatus Tectomicrobia bacterium]
MTLESSLRRLLTGIRVLPRRLSLSTPGVQATAPMLRGVWGAALHDLDSQAYLTVFEGEGRSTRRSPAFILRPAPYDPEDAPALEWVSFGAGLRHDALLLRAWDIASGMGLGPDRQRFHVRVLRLLGPDGQPCESSGADTAWPLSEAAWPLAGPPASTPCRLTFPAPLRLLRRHRLLAHPTLADLVVAGARRLQPLLTPEDQEQLAALRPQLLDLAQSIATLPWQGERLDLVRYSARQQSEIEMRGVTGHLDLPEGPGDLWPLLAAAQWLHLGKGAVVGLGQLVVEPLEPAEGRQAG